MRSIVKYWREALCVVLLCFFLWSFSFWFTSPPESLLGKYIFLFLSIADIVVFIYLLRWLWLNKWRDKLRRINEKLAERITRAFARLFEKLMKKWNVGGKKKNVISGETRISFDSASFQKEERQRRKNVKYKHLENDRERLRFLYRSMITSRIRSGERIRSQDTPSEIKVKRDNSENADKLFSMYIGARYDENAVLNENEIQRLKEGLETEFTIK